MDRKSENRKKCKWSFKMSDFRVISPKFLVPWLMIDV